MRRSLVIALGLLATSCTTFGGASDAPYAQEPPADAGGDVDEVVSSGDGGMEIDAAADADADAGFDIEVPHTWSSPNGATVTVSTEGTTITGYDSSFNHPVIVPTTPLAIPSDDYTVIADIKNVDATSEFGILTRFDARSGGVVLSSRYGTTVPAPAFIGIMAPPTWDPTIPAKTYLYSQNTNVVYRMKLKVKGKDVFASIWELPNDEPPNWQLTTVATPGARGVGYYTYGKPNCTLVKMRVTVP